MSQFEFVSIAIALVYSFAVSHVIAALPSVFASERRYWTHSLWTIVVLLAAATTWWGIWNVRDVEWTPLRFVVALVAPALIHVRAGILVTDSPAAVESWREHYFDRRVAFFSIGLVQAANWMLLPWIMGLVPWLSPAPVHRVIPLLAVISAVGLASKHPAVHAALVAASLISLSISMVAISR